MDFTREPIIETIITPKEGCRLVVRNSKNIDQEEYFVEAVEVVCFGHSYFFRSQERPKPFLVPVSDYEILEVREARMVLKHVGIDRTVKIGGGKEKETGGRLMKESKSRVETPLISAELEKEEEEVLEESGVPSPSKELRGDRKKERRRHYRKRKGKEDESALEEEPKLTSEEVEMLSTLSPRPQKAALFNPKAPDAIVPSSTPFSSSLLSPPSKLISETIGHYRDQFKNAFFSKEETQTIIEKKEEESSLQELDLLEPTRTFEVESEIEVEIGSDVESEPDFPEFAEEDLFADLEENNDLDRFRQFEEENSSLDEFPK